MQNLDLKTFPHEVREGIKEIYEDDVKKYREYNAPIDINPILARAIYTYIQELGIF